MRPACLASVLVVASLSACSASEPASSAAASPGPVPDARMDWWRAARFGLFIHWGLYAIPAGEWNGETGHGEWIMNTGHIPVERYEQFRDQFNPVKFNAEQWVATAKKAGVKYIVITSKHHDGFALFDSQVSDYDVMATPFHRDIMKELSSACRAAGLKMCWYHSIMDWHHPDYLPRRDWETRPVDGASFDRYRSYLEGQVTELLTKYGDIGVMWFDGEWESTWQHEYGKELYALCRRLQPGVIVNNRVDTGRSGMAGMSGGDDRVGDFGTPEQEIPKTGMPGVDWETCMTMNDHWGYNRHDDHWKSSAELVRMLVDIASKGGNFLLNVGPTSEGEFPPAAVERLEAMGAWLEINGESIYGTQANPGLEVEWGRCTMRAMGDTTRLYLHVLEWPKNGKLVVPGLGNEVERAWLLAHVEGSMPVRRKESDLEIEIPAATPDAVCTVVVLDVRGRPLIYRAPAIEAAASILVQPIDVRMSVASSELEIRYTLDGTEPIATSPRYRQPLRIAETTTVKARCFHDGRPVSRTTETTLTKVEAAPAVAGAAPAPGLECLVYEGSWKKLPRFEDLEPRERLIVPDLTLEHGPREHVGRVYRGLLQVPRDDVYQLALTSDDGARLRIDDQVVIDNDGLHSAEERRGTAALAAGWHPITVEYFNATGDVALALALGPAGEPLVPVAAAQLGHPAAER